VSYTKVNTYEMIQAEIVDAIEHGQPGEKLPSLTAVERKFDVSRGTARKAYRPLVEDGRVTAKPGLGYFIPKSPMTVAEAREKLDQLDAEFEDLEDDGPKPGDDLRFTAHEALLAIAHAGDLGEFIAHAIECHPGYDPERDLLSLRYTLEAASTTAECIYANAYSWAA
jgi:DNA-binding transcriptional regulator YhcF (GntR family)